MSILRTRRCIGSSVFGLVVAASMAMCGGGEAQETKDSGPAGPTIITVSDETIVRSPRRLGVNIGESTYYGDQQIVANPFVHGGFHQGREALVIQVTRSTGNEVWDNWHDADNPWNRYTESLAGGRYAIMTGERAGEEGAIREHDVEAGRYALEHDGAPLAKSDVLVLQGPWVKHGRPLPEQHEPMLGIGDFRRKPGDGVEIDLVEASGEGTNQYLRFAFSDTAGRSNGAIKHYIAATTDTTYRIRIRARSDIEGARIGVKFKCLAIPYNEPGGDLNMVCDRDRSLTPEWQVYEFKGTTPRDPRVGERFAEITMGVSAEPAGSGRHAWFDSVTLDDNAMDHPSGFGAPVVEFLKNSRCGVLRFYGIAGLGSLIDSITAPDSTRATWSFLSDKNGYKGADTCAVVDQWMLLCREVGAAPWMTIGSPNTPAGYYNLISYLAAPPDFDAYARRRANHGYEKPWTESVETVYIEIGNEWWNGIFKPYYIWPPEKYGELCTTIIEKVKSHPHFDADRIKFIVGGWAINAHHWNGKLDAAAQGHDYLSLAPYLVHEGGKGDAGDLVRAMFADVEGYAAGGATSTLRDLRDNGKNTRLAIYELNTHTTGGSAPASLVSEVAPSVGAGVAVLDQAMRCMRDMGADPINYFTLFQRGYGHGDNYRRGLWGTVTRTESGELVPRPTWLGLELANRYLIEGDMVRCTVENSPTWDQPEYGSVGARQHVPYIHAYAFRSGEAPERQVNLLIINRHLEQTLPVKVTLPFYPQPAARRIVLTADTYGAMNEESVSVRLKKEKTVGLGKQMTVEVPPFSAVVYQSGES